MKKGGPLSPKIGSVGEHLAIAHLLETNLDSNDFSKVFPDIEIFHVDRGTDLGLDYILRIIGKGGFSLMVGVQVKATYSSNSSIRKPSKKIRELVRPFPGPLVLLKYRDRARTLRLLDYRSLIEDKGKTRGKKYRVNDLPVQINQKEGKDGYVCKIADWLLDLCKEYFKRASDPERDLAVFNIDKAKDGAMRILEMDPDDDSMRLLLNRIEIRGARWKPKQFLNIRKKLDRQKRAWLRRRVRKLGKYGVCPDYDGYCIHYQAAIVRDEWLRASSRRRRWVHRTYKSIRSELMKAFRQLAPDNENKDKFSYPTHSDDVKRKLYRYGVGLLAEIIAVDIFNNRSGSENVANWKRLYGELTKVAGKSLERAVNLEDKISLILGEIYCSYVTKCMGNKLRVSDVSRWRGRYFKKLDKRPKNRDSDENAVLYFLGASLFAKIKKWCRALDMVVTGEAIAKTVRGPLWLSPLEVARTICEENLP
ncbi:MAG: hypothetical protein HYV05_09645 [Deltaproteobacteria bacterium]|nr:hypothetical protein [Deltaproteobacteria bacterium]